MTSRSDDAYPDEFSVVETATRDHVVGDSVTARARRFLDQLLH